MGARVVELIDRRAWTEALHERWREALRPGERFDVSARREAEALQVRISLWANGDEDRYDFEAGCVVPPEGVEVDEALLALADCADELLAAFFEADRIAHLPLDWTRREHPVLEVHVRYAHRRPRLEAAADALLARAKAAGTSDGGA